MYRNMDIWTDMNQLEHNNKYTLYPYIIITSIGNGTKNLFMSRWSHICVGLHILNYQIFNVFFLVYIYFTLPFISLDYV